MARERREDGGRGARDCQREKKKAKKGGDVGKQINSSVGSSRVFSGVAPNICFARRRPRCLIPDRHGYTVEDKSIRYRWKARLMSVCDSSVYDLISTTVLIKLQIETLGRMDT